MAVVGKAASAAGAQRASAPRTARHDHQTQQRKSQRHCSDLRKNGNNWAGQKKHECAAERE